MRWNKGWILVNNHYKNFAASVQAALPTAKLFLNESMQRHTSFRIGGPADCLAIPQNEAELVALLEMSKAHHVPVTVIGNGSNLLVKDKGVRGLVIKLGGGLLGVQREENRLSAGAGMTLAAVAFFAAAQSLSGMEFAVGIPGSLGGAVYMNAGAYDGEMSGIVGNVTAVTPEGVMCSFSHEAMQFSYRHSCLQANRCIVTGVELVLQTGDKAAIQKRMDEFTARRIAKQPLQIPNAGSMFKRPPGHFAGTLIEEAGLKGVSVGGAQVSEKHAGFVVNTGGATAADVLQLIEKIKENVFAKTHVMLEPEVRILGE